MPTDLFTILQPQGKSLPIVANLPHSGLLVPQEIADSFTEHQRQTLPNSDWHLQQLYSFLPSLGITIMQANYSRYVVDLNRALKVPFFGSFWSAVVSKDTAFRQPIYQQTPINREPSKGEVRSRIDQYYTPYHQALSALLKETIQQHGKVYLLDLHSFMGLITDDVCLGNANGKTCRDTTIAAAEYCFHQQNYQVVKNKVFTGGYITQHYGKQPNVEALQVELHYPTYLPDDQLDIEAIPKWHSPKFSAAQAKLEAVFTQLTSKLTTAKKGSTLT
ncbi:MAG: N-formylglutamate amidohydrolase [Cyanobacteria bacterium J06607_10]